MRRFAVLLLLATGACERAPELNPELSPEIARIIHVQEVPGVSRQMMERVALEIMRSGAPAAEQLTLLKSQLAVLGEAASVARTLHANPSEDLLGAVSAALAAGISRAQVEDIAKGLDGLAAAVRLDRVTALVTGGMPLEAARIVAEQEYR